MKEAAIALHPPGLPLAKNIPPAQTSSTQTIDSTLQRRNTLHTFGDNLIELFNLQDGAPWWSHLNLEFHDLVSGRSQKMIYISWSG